MRRSGGRPSNITWRVDHRYVCVCYIVPCRLYRTASSIRRPSHDVNGKQSWVNWRYRLRVYIIERGQGKMSNKFYAGLLPPGLVGKISTSHGKVGAECPFYKVPFCAAKKLKLFLKEESGACSCAGKLLRCNFTEIY